MTDLFGSELPPDPTIKPDGTKRRTTLPRGHIAPPGSGPEGECCRSCKHYTLKHHHDYVHRKCGLNEANWTKGPGSDIRASDPACSKWEKEQAT